jgi:putative sigma-54 modulation protein
MQIHISPRQVKVTAPIKAYIEQKIGHLEHYAARITSAHVSIFHDETRAVKHAFCVKVHLTVPGPNLHAEDHGHDLYQAIDLVTERLAEQLRHRKSKLTKGRRELARKAKQKRLAAGV